jgi:hypothetical protein
VAPVVQRDLGLATFRHGVSVATTGRLAAYLTMDA